MSAGRGIFLRARPAVPLVEAQLGYQLFEPRVLIRQLLELAGLRRLQPSIFFLPAIKGLFRDPDLADQVGHRQTQFGLFQHRNDLLDRKTFPFHLAHLPSNLRGMRRQTNSPAGPLSPGQIKVHVVIYD
jgi:hypothetical protein